MPATVEPVDRPTAGEPRPTRAGPRHDDAPESARPSRRAAVVVPAALAVAVWALLIALSRAWGMYLEATGTRLILFTPPVIGGYRLSIPTSLIAVLAVGVASAVALPHLVGRARWPHLLVASTGAAALWWVALALVDGVTGLTQGLDWSADYTTAVGRVTAAPGGFLRDYVATLPDQPIALRGHPPGFALLFGLLDAVGLRGDGWAAALVVLGALSAVPAVLRTLRAVAGERQARRAAPFLALTPAATWIVTSTDGLTMATATWVIALVALAGAPGASARRSNLCAGAAGLVAAFAVLQSYGMVLLALPVLAIAWYQHRWRPVVVAGVVAAVAVLSLGAWGFWWFAGLAATAHEYRTLEVQRPYGFFVVANLGAWALALGPATAAGLATLRHRATWVVVGGGLAGALVADVSGMSSGEVERIWLPFTFLVLPAAAAVWGSRRVATGWLVAQVASAVVFTAFVRANW